MNVNVDYLPKKDYCRFEIDDLDVFERLREEFSVPNEAKKFVKGPNRRFIPDRIYFITPTGQLTLICLTWKQSLSIIMREPHRRALSLKAMCQAVLKMSL